jgi:CheY-like chemotaxis protein
MNLEKSMQKLILVVDDDQPIREVITELVSDEDNYKAIAAESAEKALGIIKGLNFDIILLDLEMPGMDGNEFLQELSTSAPAVPVIVISANPKKLKPHPQVKSVIAKPFDIEQLMAVLEKYLS